MKTTNPAAAHTPGPWHVNPGDYRIRGSQISISDSPAFSARPIVAVFDAGESELAHGQTKANARLIASAPELLAALERAHLELHAALPFLTVKYGNRSDANAAIEQARAAIARATGVQS